MNTTGFDSLRRSLLLAALVTIGFGFSGAPALAGAHGGGGLVLVAGATGGTGREVVRELDAQGFKVRAFVRDADAAREKLGEGIEYAQGDVRDRKSIDAALDGVVAIISAIGAGRKEPGNGPEFVDYGGVKNLADAGAAADVRQMVLVSSAGVTDEDHMLNRMFDNVLIWKGKGEQALRDSGIAYTIVRPGGLVNKDGGEAPVRLEQGDTGTGVIPRADVAKICVAALMHDEARNRTFEAFSDEGSPDNDWAALFGGLQPDP